MSIGATAADNIGDDEGAVGSSDKKSFPADEVSDC